MYLPPAAGTILVECMKFQIVKVRFLPRLLSKLIVDPRRGGVSGAMSEAENEFMRAVLDELSVVQQSRNYYTHEAIAHRASH